MGGHRGLGAGWGGRCLTTFGGTICVHAYLMGHGDEDVLVHFCAHVKLSASVCAWGEAIMGLNQAHSGESGSALRSLSAAPGSAQGES